MLTDSRAIEIISKAKQANVRDPKRNRVPFENIMTDFFDEADFGGSKWLDLGPGQFDFGVLALERGAIVSALDKDPAVVALGEYLGFTTTLGDIRDIATLFDPGAFDGLFCKYSVNALWFRSVEDVERHVKQMVSLLQPAGWAWIAPWNGIPKSMEPGEAEPLLSTQRSAFLALGFDAIDLTEEQSRYYGIHGNTANRVVFMRRPVGV